MVAGKMAEIRAKIGALQATYDLLEGERARLVASAIATGLTIPEFICAGA